MKKITVLALLFALTVLAGCETTRGIGKDIENTGQNIQQGLQKIEKKVSD